MEPAFTFFLTSSLEKVLPTRKPSRLEPNPTVSAWPGSRANIQLVYRCDGCFDGGLNAQFFSIKVSGGPVEAKLCKVGLVPVEMPVFENADEDYITKDPALLPDVLAPSGEAYYKMFHRQYRSLWISWLIPEHTDAGDYPISIQITRPSATISMGGILSEVQNPAVTVLPITLRVCRKELPELPIVHTELFHTDCLQSHYGVKAFSDEHWKLIENYLKSAVQEHQINDILTPLFTPPMDTKAFTERPTVQLVEVFVEDGVYHFDFANLKKWLEICRDLGVKYLELPPFFTQWGAEYTAKVMATVDGVETKLFDWGVPAASREYRRFLEAMLPQAFRVFEEYGFDRSRIIVKVSDEPQPGQEEQFAAAKNQLQGLVDGCFELGSVGSLSYLKTGLVKCPIIEIQMVDEFRAAGVKDYQFYYCCAHGDQVPNRFIAMESYRNRIMGVLMYLYECGGFGHWGFNFWNSALSIYQLDPYRNDHAEWCFPSGDAYLVYPGADGMPVSSIRAEVQDEAFFDFRGLRLLESLTDRAYVVNLIHQVLGEDEITMTHYPKDAKLLLDLRERLVEEIDAHS